MFKKSVTYFIIGWFVVVFIGILFIYKPSSSALENYAKWGDNGNQIKNEFSDLDLKMTQQIRHQVSKQVIYNKDSQRMQSRFASNHSNLVFESHNGQMELIENFQGLSGCLQENLNSSNEEEELHHFRRFQAKEGVYYYKNGELIAENVEMSHYNLSTTNWPYSFDSFAPSFQGKAQKIQLSIYNDSLFKAHDFQLILHQWINE